jgi:hypothetical protein
MVEILLGHLIGDYLLQNNWMALGKSKHNGLGWFTCTVHCLLYTVAVVAMTQTVSVSWCSAVFASHFFIDKFSLAEAYLKAINGRSLERFMAARENQTYSPHIALRAGFDVLVYTVVDNTMHLLLLYWAWGLSK